MQRIIVDMNDVPADTRAASARSPRRTVRIIMAVFALLIAAAGTGGYLYWRSLKDTPQYSLALLVDAARNNDQATTDSLVDIDAVVDDFMPQITDKAVELYGRGLPPKTIEKVARVTAPVMPAVKDRARAELPRAIRERTGRLGNVPFAAMVLGADRYLDIEQSGDTATVRSKMQGRPLEVTMRRNGSRWKIVGVKDEQLATNIAQRIGQEIIAVASNGGVDGAGERLGISNLTNILKQAEQIFR